MTILLLLAQLTTAQIAIDVNPKATIANEFTYNTFRVRVIIPEHKDNRRFSYSADCGGTYRSSQKEIDHVVYEWYEELVVKDDCYFLACLHRIVDGKVKNICVHQEVLTNASENHSGASQGLGVR